MTHRLHDTVSTTMTLPTRSIMVSGRRDRSEAACTVHRSAAQIWNLPTLHALYSASCACGAAVCVHLVFQSASTARVQVRAAWNVVRILLKLLEPTSIAVRCLRLGTWILARELAVRIPDLLALRRVTRAYCKGRCMVGAVGARAVRAAQHIAFDRTASARVSVGARRDAGCVGWRVAD